MADPNIKDTARTTDSTQATGLMASSASPPGLANKFLSSDTSATAMAKFSLRSLGHGTRDSMASYRGPDAGIVHGLGGHVP